MFLLKVLLHLSRYIIISTKYQHIFIFFFNYFLSVIFFISTFLHFSRLYSFISERITFSRVGSIGSGLLVEINVEAVTVEVVAVVLVTAVLETVVLETDSQA